VPVHISGIKMIGPEQVLLLLADEAESRAVPISVGREQGIAIYLGRMKADTPRPMTHDLLANILGVLGATIERITVTDLKSDVYFAEISLMAGGRIHAVDARPSDAIALAVRTGAPMFAAPGLLRSLDAPGTPDRTIHADRRLGLTVQELDPELAESIGAPGVTGVLVSSVARGGLAERAGIRRGDIVRALDGRAIPTLPAYREASASAVKSLTVWREGRESTFRTP
jgi:bifunctional DNase/RNase